MLSLRSTTYSLTTAPARGCLQLPAVSRLTTSLPDLGAPVGRPHYRVVPYGSGGNGNGAWDESDGSSSEDMDEDFIPMVSTTHSIQLLLNHFCFSWRPPPLILMPFALISSTPRIPAHIMVQHYLLQQPPDLQQITAPPAKHPQPSPHLSPSS